MASVAQAGRERSEAPGGVALLGSALPALLTWSLALAILVTLVLADVGESRGRARESA